MEYLYVFDENKKDELIKNGFKYLGEYYIEKEGVTTKVFKFIYNEPKIKKYSVNMDGCIRATSSTMFF